MINLKQIVVEQKYSKKEKQCPAPTQDLELNTANRDRAIQTKHIKYGPLN